MSNLGYLVQIGAPAIQRLSIKTNSMANPYKVYFPVGCMIFKTKVRVRFSETDLAGWVYYGNYFVYFEVGRSAMYRELGFNYADLKNEGIVLPMVEAHGEYKHPAQYDDVLEIHTRIVDVRKKPLKTVYDIYADGVLLVTGYCVQVCVGADGKSRPFPEKLKKKLLEVVE